MILRPTLVLLACLTLHAAEDIPAATALTGEAARLARGLVDPPQRAAALRDIVRLRAALPAKADAETALAEFAAAVAAMPDGSRYFGTWVVEETQRVSGATAALPIAKGLDPISRNSAIAAVFVRDMDAGADPIAGVRAARAAIGKPEDVGDVFVGALRLVAKRGDAAGLDELAGAAMAYAGVTDDPVEPVVAIAVALAKAGKDRAAATVMGQAQLATQRYPAEHRDHALGVVAVGWGGIGDLKQAIVTAKLQSNPFMPPNTIASAFRELMRVQGPEKAVAAIGLLPIAADRSPEIGAIAREAADRKLLSLAESLAAQIEQPFPRSDALIGLLIAHAEAGAMDKATSAAATAVSATMMVTEHPKRAICLSSIVGTCVRYGIPVPERDKVVADMVAWPGRADAKLRTYAAADAAETLWSLGAEAEAKAAAAGCGDKESEPCDRAVVRLHKAKRPVPTSLLAALRDAATRSSPAAAADALGTISWVQAGSGDLAGSMTTAKAIADPHGRKTAMSRVARTMAANGDVVAVRNLLADNADEGIGIRIAMLVAAAGELTPKAATGTDQAASGP